MIKELASEIPVKKSQPIQWPLWLLKMFYYEYWPFWILFLPSALYALMLGVRARSFTYFTAANPAIELGGFFGESKSRILKMVPAQYKPVTFLVTSNASAQAILEEMKIMKLQFPVIAKPDKGERGLMVKKLQNEHNLQQYVNRIQRDFIIQEFVDYSMELGVLYYRYPGSYEHGITSVVLKEFLSVTGDGISTIEQLMSRSLRARMQIKRLREQGNIHMEQILAPGEVATLEKIGNHCKGTKFLNGNQLINSKLVEVFDNIASNMPGFYFGRFDLRVPSLNDLYEGKNIKILEVNGTTSEPAHIYNPGYGFLKAQRDILFHTRLVYRIAMHNHNAGIPFTPFREALRIVTEHMKHTKEHGD